MCFQLLEKVRSLSSHWFKIFNLRHYGEALSIISEADFPDRCVTLPSHTRITLLVSRRDVFAISPVGARDTRLVGGAASAAFVHSKASVG